MQVDIKRVKQRIEEMTPRDIEAELGKALGEIVELVAKEKFSFPIKVLSASLTQLEVFSPKHKAIIAVRKITNGSYSVEIKYIYEPELQEIAQTLTQILEKPFTPITPEVK